MLCVRAHVAGEKREAPRREILSAPKGRVELAMTLYVDFLFAVCEDFWAGAVGSLAVMFGFGVWT